MKTARGLARRQRSFLGGVSGQIVAWATDYPERILILIIGLTLTVDVTALLIEPPSLRSGGTGNWWPLIVNVVRGQGYTVCDDSYFPFCKAASQETAQREPLPVLAFSALAALTDESLWAASFLQVALHAAIAITVFYMTMTVADNRAAILATLMWAVYLPAVTLVNSVGGDLLATLFTTLGFLLLLNSGKPWRVSLGAGLCFGLAALSRSAILALTFVLIVALAWKPLRATTLRRFVFHDLRPVAVFSIAFFAVVSPWAIRNYLVFDRVVIGTTLVGYNLYRHNAVIQTENYLHYVGPEEAEAEIKALLARRADLLGTENEAQMDKIYREAAVEIITAHPFRYVTLSAYRFFPLWFNWRIPEIYGEQRPALDYLTFFQQGALLALTILGVRRIGRRGGLLAVSILVVVFLHMAVNGRLRFLQVVMPVIVVLSAVGSEVMWRWLKVKWAYRTKDG